MTEVDFILVAVNQISNKGKPMANTLGTGEANGIFQIQRWVKKVYAKDVSNEKALLLYRASSMVVEYYGFTNTTWFLKQEFDTGTPANFQSSELAFQAWESSQTFNHE